MQKRVQTWDQPLRLMYGPISGPPPQEKVEAGFNSQKLHHLPPWNASLSAFNRWADCHHKPPAGLFEGRVPAA